MSTVVPISVEQIVPGSDYRIIQEFVNGTTVAVQGRVILSFDKYVSFQSAGRFNVHPHVGMPNVYVYRVVDE